LALLAFREIYNTNWLIQRHDSRTEMKLVEQAA